MPKRIELVQGEYYHIYNRGAGRQSIFFEERNYRYLLRLLKGIAAECQVAVIAYALIPNHYLLRHGQSRPAVILGSRSTLSPIPSSRSRFGLRTLHHLATVLLHETGQFLPVAQHLIYHLGFSRSVRAACNAPKAGALHVRFPRPQPTREAAIRSIPDAPLSLPRATTDVVVAERGRMRNGLSTRPRSAQAGCRGGCL